MRPTPQWLLFLALLFAFDSALAFGPYKWSTSLISSASYTMHWNLTNDHIYIGLKGTTNGYLAVGFGQSASMAPADIVLGYVASGTAHLNDYYSTSHNLPTIDPSQNLEGSKGLRTGNTLELEFNRLLNTGDSRDRIVDPFASIDLIYAIGNANPSSPTNYNKHNSEGTKKIVLCQSCASPAMPTPVQMRSNSKTSIEVEWAEPFDGDATITAYRLDFWKITFDGVALPSTNVTVNLGAVLQYNATGLNPSSQYRFQVRATNGVGTGFPSDPSVEFLRTLSAAPAAPSAPFGQDVTETEVSLAWEAEETTLEPTTGFTVQFKEFGAVSPFTTGCTAANAPCTINSLTAGTEYEFVVFATNNIGDSEVSEVLNFKTNEIGAVLVGVGDITAPTASNLSSTSVRLTWSIPSVNGGAEILRYKVERSNVTNESAPTPFTSVYEDRHPTFFDTTLSRRSRFQYRMSVINGVGESQSVEVISVVQTPADPPSAPTSLSLLDYGRNWLHLGWTIPADDGGSIVQNYTVKVEETVFSESLVFAFNASGLAPSTAYNVSVAANNAFGRGDTIGLVFETAACESNGDCSGHGICNVTTWLCDCDEGFRGDFCEAALLSGSIGDDEFEFSFEDLDGDYKLYWTLEETQIRFAMEVKGAASGWAGMGIGKDMSDDADIFVGRFLNNVLTVGDYVSRGTGTPSLDTTLGGVDSIIAFAGSRNGDILVVKWIRPIEALDNNDKAIHILATDGQDIIVAYYSDSSALNYHGSNLRSQLKVNWVTGEVLGRRSQSPIRIAHGVMMILGWFFLTAGALVARYLRWIQKSGDLWFRLHRANQLFWFLVVLIAFIISWVMVHNAKGTHFGKVAHSLCGLITVCLAFMQVAWALLRPEVQKDDQGKPLSKQTAIRSAWQYSHYFLGPTAALLAIPTIFLGLYQLAAPLAAYLIYGICMGIQLLIVILLEILRALGVITPIGQSEDRHELQKRSK